MKQGIINQGNLCFLNSILQCLANSLTIPQEQIGNTFRDYLHKTLEYIQLDHTLKNIYLFSLELKRRNPYLFSYIEQQPQDAFEALCWLVEEAQLSHQIQLISSYFQQYEVIQIQPEPNYITLQSNWVQSYRYYMPNQNMLKEEDIQQIRKILKCQHQEEIELIQLHQNTRDHIDIYTLLDFSHNKYYIQILIQSKQCITIQIQLQYIENDVIIDIKPTQAIQINIEINSFGKLRKQVQDLLNDIHIWFDFVVFEEIIELEEEIIDFASITKDLEEFLKCKYLSEPIQVYNQPQLNNSMQIEYLSDIVVIQLQRFVQLDQCLIKNTNPYFPPQQLLCYVDSQAHKYELNSICCHLGDGVNGHYVNYILQNNIWEYIDDESIITRELDYQLFKYSYIVFYKLVQETNNEQYI